MMIAKFIGAALIFAVCTGTGVYMSGAHKRKERLLEELSAGLSYMENDLRYRLTPLPSLLVQTALYCDGMIGAYFNKLATELDKQICADVYSCTCAALSHFPKLPESINGCLLELGKNLGKLDKQGQLNALVSARNHVECLLKQHCADKEAHRRSYRTLGFCAGAGLVILFV